MQPFLYTLIIGRLTPSRDGVPAADESFSTLQVPSRGTRRNVQMEASMKKSSLWLVAAIAALSTGIGMSGSSASADESCMKFPETGHAVCGKFLNYWNNHDGLAQQGYPISDEMSEKNLTDGKTYTVQYFQRAVFEAHPDQAPQDVQLSLLGVWALKAHNAAQSCQCNAETNPMPVNADDNKSVTLAGGWWDIEDTTCGGLGTQENGCHEFYPVYSNGSMVLPPYSANNGHRRAWKVRGGRVEANCTVRTEAEEFGRQHPSFHVTYKQVLTDK